MKNYYLLLAISLLGLTACSGESLEDLDNLQNTQNDSAITLGQGGEPSSSPTPSVAPSMEPTVEPTLAPSFEPTYIPSVEPTYLPTLEPTVEPTAEPTSLPTVEPTIEPTAEPTYSPTMDPTSITDAMAKLPNREWTLVSYGYEHNVQNVMEGNLVTIEFIHVDRSLIPNLVRSFTGTFDCNQLSGNYVYEPEFSLSNISVTERIGCMLTPAEDYQDEFNSIWSNLFLINDLSVDETDLVLTTEEGFSFFFEISPSVMPPPIPFNGLEGRDWNLVLYGTSGEESTLIENTAYQLRFNSEDLSISGYWDCNSLLGNYTLEPDFTVGDFVSTLIACPAMSEDGYFAQDQDISEMLANVVDYYITGEQLNIDTDDGRSLIFIDDGKYDRLQRLNEQNQELWQSQQIDDYQFVYYAGPTDCPWVDVMPPATVTVELGVVSSVYVEELEHSGDPDHYLTIEDLFAEIAQSISSKPYQINAGYDDNGAMGIPARFQENRSKQECDAYEIIISDFEAL